MGTLEDRLQEIRPEGRIIRKLIPFSERAPAHIVSRIVYDMDREKTICEVPTWGHPQSISVSGEHVLISYGSSAHPELWKLVVPMDEITDLELQQIYSAMAAPGYGGSEFLGPLKFGLALHPRIVLPVWAFDTHFSCSLEGPRVNT